MSHTISILTYNIHKGFGPGNIHFQLPKMRDALCEVDADLLLLQEVQGEHRRHQKQRVAWPSICQAEYLAEETWPHLIYAKNAVYQLGHHGNAILSKFQIEEWSNIDVSHHYKASRSVLQSCIRLPAMSSPLYVLCIHFGLFKAERFVQVEQLIETIQTTIPIDAPLIVAGDFNDWQFLLSPHLERELQLQEAFVELMGEYAKSFPAWRATLSIDRIYYRGLNLIECACLNAKPWRTLSDHLPLWAKFSIPSPGNTHTLS